MTKCLLEIPLPNRLRLFPCKAKVGHDPSVALLQLHGRKIRYDGHLRRKRRGLHPKLGRQQRHFARCKESEPVRKPGRRSFRDDAPIPFRQHILPEPDCLRIAGLLLQRPWSKLLPLLLGNLLRLLRWKHCA